MQVHQIFTANCLNPCCNGIYLIIVLLLILATLVCLNPCCNGIYLIIIANGGKTQDAFSLNPCCNGIYLIIKSSTKRVIKYAVLILVVMEYT